MHPCEVWKRQSAKERAFLNTDSRVKVTRSKVCVEVQLHPMHVHVTRVEEKKKSNFPLIYMEKKI